MADPNRNSVSEFTAGSKVLIKFQNQWEQLHKNSENNVIKAKEVVHRLNCLERAAAKQMITLDDFSLGYRSLAKVEEHISDIDNDLRHIESCFTRIEDCLTVLRNHRENIDTELHIQNKKSEFREQARIAKVSSSIRKEKLRNEHLARVEELDRKQSLELEERRQVLEKAFEEEKKQYLENKSKESNNYA